MIFNQATVTSAGRSNLTSAIANKQSINFTAICFGSYRAPITRTYMSGGTLRVVGELDNSNITRNTTFNKVELLARRGSDSEFVYATATSATGNTTIPSKSNHVMKIGVSFDTQIAGDGQVNFSVTVNERERKKYVATASGSTSYTISHNLGTQDIVVAIWSNRRSQWTLDVAETDIINNNQIRINVADRYKNLRLKVVVLA